MLWSLRFLPIVLCVACVGTITDGHAPLGAGADGGTADAAALGEADGAPTARYSSVHLLGHYPMTRASDLVATSDGNTIAISGWTEGTVHIVDVTDKASPVLREELSGIGYNADVQIQGNSLFVSHEDTGLAPFLGNGVTIYDLNALPQRVGALDETSGNPGLENCHNTWPHPDRELFYCASTTTGRVVVMSTAAPASTRAPRVLTDIAPPTGGMVHDMYARADLLYVAWLDGGFAIYDVSNPEAPQQIGGASYPGAFTHSAWPSGDGTVLYTTDEVPGGHIRIWDISDPAAPEEIGSYQPNAESIVHNAAVIDDYVLISHYTEGLKVLDARDPRAPVEIGGHDFYEGPDRVEGNFMASMSGAWGVDAVLPYVFVSGTDSGLWIYELRP